MKRVIFGFITITALAVLGFAPFANAQQGNHNKQSTDIGYSLPAGKKHSGNIYTSSRNIQINGILKVAYTVLLHRYWLSMVELAVM